MSIFIFVAKSFFITVILMAWYWLGLRNRKIHTYNRFFLLFTLYASVQVPFLNFNWLKFNSPAPLILQHATAIIIPASNNGSVYNAPVQAGHKAVVNPSQVILFIMATVSATLLLMMAKRIITIVMLSKKFPGENTDGIRLIHTNLANAPFSFMNMMFWKNTIPLNSDNGQLIFHHELAHIRQGHTYDKLLSQFFTSIFWFNPFYWLIQKELNIVHEFIADEAAISGNDTDAFARMLLQSHNNGSYLSPQHHFFSSPIKRRLLMLQISVYTKHTWPRRLAVIPLLAGTIFILSFRSSMNDIVPAEKKIVLMVDAAHGGLDNGCSNGPLKEKDLCLKIANRISVLAPRFNIDVRLTRSTDEYVTLNNRVAICDKIHPDDFIAIHISAGSKDDTGTGNFTVYAANDNPELQKSVRMGNAVAEQMIMHGEEDKTRQVAKRGIYVLRHNSVSSVALELGDINNVPMINKLTDDNNIDRLCTAILQGVVNAHKQ